MPEPFVSGSILKLVAMISMLIDHISSFILSGYSTFSEPFLTLAGKGISVVWIGRTVGRLAFPIYCFLLVEGFIYTKSRKKYGLRLFIFALISELPWNFVHTGGLLCSTQNVMFTLLFGYLALCALNLFSEEKLKQLALLVALFFVCCFGKTDYGVKGLGLILILFFLRNENVLKGIVGTCMLGNIRALPAFIPIGFYNGKRGFMKGSFAKYAAYLFYPVHLLLLGILRYILFA